MSGSWEIVSNRKVFVYSIHTEITSMAWAAMFRRLIIPGDFEFFTGMPYDHCRNSAVYKFLSTPHQWLFSIDSDVFAPPDTILRLLSRNLPVVSALYSRRSPPHSVPVMIKNGSWVTNYTPGSLVEVDWVGAGALLIHRSIFERMPPQRPGKPFFDWRVDLRGTGAVPEDTCLSEDFTMCFPAGTWVGGPSIKRIEEVRVGDSVISHDGSINKVLETSHRLYSGEMIRVTANHVRGIESTAGHKFLIKEGKVARVAANLSMSSSVESPTALSETRESRWTEARDIKLGDWLYVPKHKWDEGDAIRSLRVENYVGGLHEFPSGLLGYRRTRKNALRVPPEIEITPSLCRLIGYYLAEGFTSGYKNTVQFAFGSHEGFYIDDCRGLLRDVFGAESSLAIKGGGARIVNSSSILGRMFSEFGGNGAYNKHLPSFWSQLDQNCLKDLIKGYWRGDGYYDERRSVFSFNTMSERLARELQAALLKLDILCGMSTTQGTKGTVHRGLIPIHHSMRFAEVVGEDIGLVVPYKRGKKVMQETDSHFLVKVVDVEKFFREVVVFNLKVDSRESYTANGVAVHNCQHIKRTLGISTFVDTSIVCRHVGLAEFTHGNVQPLNHAA